MVGWLNIFIQDDHFSYRNCYQHGSCVHNTKDINNITYERQPQHRDHPAPIRIVRGFFNVPQNYQNSRNCETGPPTYRPYPRRQESLTICRWNYKGSTNYCNVKQPCSLDKAVSLCFLPLWCITIIVIIWGVWIHFHSYLH